MTSVLKSVRDVQYTEIKCYIVSFKIIILENPEFTVKSFLKYNIYHVCYCTLKPVKTYLEGIPCLSVAFLKAVNAVDARLFVAAFKHITCYEKFS